MSANETVGPRLLVISGSTRHGSTNTALCRTAAAAADDGVTVDCWPSVAILPHFNPDDDRDPLPAPVVALRGAVASADAVLFCTPEYAGTLPGSFKNLLDWMVGGTELTDKPVAWVNVNVDPARGRAAHAHLATVLGYVQARIVAAACHHVPVSREQVGPDGLIADAEVRGHIAQAIHALLADAAS
jgi:NAD(P)H-dependent FMN reductase